jgi:hypothetical protein
MGNEDRALRVAEHRDPSYFAPLTPNGGRGVRLLALAIDLMRDGLGDTLIEAVGQQHRTAPPLRKVRPQEATDEKKARSGEGASFVKSI